MNLKHYEFDGLILPIREDTGYIDATALSSKYFEKTGKYRKPSQWLELKRTQETIEYVSNVTGIFPNALVIRIKGGNNTNDTGTFLHPDLAIPFASWLSVEFEYKVTKIIQHQITDSSSSGLISQINDLRRVLDVAYSYLKGAQAVNRTIHNATHNESGVVNSALKEIETFIKKYDPRF